MMKLDDRQKFEAKRARARLRVEAERELRELSGETMQRYASADAVVDAARGRLAARQAKTVKAQKRLTVQVTKVTKTREHA